MFNVLRQAIATGPFANNFPDVINEPPDGFRGKPVIDFARCTACDKCAEACPTNAITVQMSGGADGAAASCKVLSLSYGDCIFCGECEAACPDVVHLTKEFMLASRRKEDLVTRAEYKMNEHGTFELSGIPSSATAAAMPAGALGEKLRTRIDAVLGRSLHIRQVDAGSCNGCEVEITALNNPVYDIERFGIHFVASPRHADMLLVTGPVTRNMEIALKKTYEAVPDPKLVVAVGACAIGGGIFGKSYASCGGVDAVLPVDVYIPGCPPRPEALLHGILLAVERMAQKVHGKRDLHAGEDTAS